MEQNSSRLVSSDESWLQKIQERGAVHQNSAPLLLCSQEHQQACDDRGVRCQRRVCEYVGAHLYCMSASPSVSVSESCSKLWVSARAVSAAWGDRPRIQAWQCDWIQWESQWSNKYLSVSSAPWGFCAQPTGPGPALPVQSRWKVRRGGNWGWRKASELQTLSATVKVTAAKQAAMDGWMRVWEVFELIWKHQM